MVAVEITGSGEVPRCALVRERGRAHDACAIHQPCRGYSARTVLPKDVGLQVRVKVADKRNVSRAGGSGGPSTALISKRVHRLEISFADRVEHAGGAERQKGIVAGARSPVAE